MRKIEAARTFNRLALLAIGRQEGRLLDFPRLASIQAPREAHHRGLGPVDGMAAFIVFEIAEAEAGQNLVAPRPDAVVRRPAAEPARLPENHYRLGRRRALSKARRRDEEAYASQRFSHGYFAAPVPVFT